jgi:hypothetical protein
MQTLARKTAIAGAAVVMTPEKGTSNRCVDTYNTINGGGL